MIPRAQIYPNPNQPRKAFDAGELEQLRASIADHGVMQPLEVMHAPSRFNGAPYRIIFGERRWRASEGVADALPCIIADISQDEADERMMDENFQRNDLTAEEEAAVVRHYMEQGLSVAQIARRRNKSEGWVYNRINYLKVGDDVREVGGRVRKALSSLVLVDKVKDKTKRADLLHRIEAQELPFADVKTKVEAHLEAAESAARAAANAAEQAKAPDKETNERQNAHERGESSSVSRGQRVTGGVSRPAKDERKQKNQALGKANQEVRRALMTLKSWLPLCDNKTHQEATDVARSIVRGDLARESSR